MHLIPLRRALLALLIMVVSGALHAVGSNGIYATTDNNYRIEVRFEPGQLVVIEPNKESRYQQRGNSAVYYFKNPTNGIEYLLEAMPDGKSLKASKPLTPDNFTLLKLVEAAAGKDSGPCKALAIPVQNDQALNPDQERLWGIRALPDANVLGTYLEEGKGSPVVELRSDGSGKFEMFGAPKPQHVYQIEWWLQANCDGTPVANDYPAATQYFLIVEYKDKPYQGMRFNRIGLSVQKAPEGEMYIFSRSKHKN